MTPLSERAPLAQRALCPRVECPRVNTELMGDFWDREALPRSQRDYLPPSRPLPQRDTLPLLLNPSRAPSLLLLLDSYSLPFRP